MSGGNADGGEGGRGGDLGVAGDHRGVDSVDGVRDNRGSDGMMGVAHDRGNSVVSRVDTVVRLSLPLAVAVDTVAISETIRPVATVVATKTVASIAVVGIGISLRLGGGEGRK